MSKISMARKTCFMLLALSMVIGFFCILMRAGMTQEPQLSGDLAVAISALQQREQQVTSAQGEFLQETSFNKDPLLVKRLGTNDEQEKMRPARQVTKVNWRFEGNRFHEETVMLDVSQQDLPDVSDSRMITAFDGEKGYYYEPATHYAMEVSSDKTRLVNAGIDGQFGYWMDLAFKYGTGRPLSEILMEKNANPIGSETVNGFSCIRLDAPPDGSGTRHVWWLAPDLGYAVIKYEYSNNLPTGSIARWVRETAYMSSNGIWLPKERTLTAFTRFSDGQEFWVRKTKISALSLQVNQPLGIDLFQPGFASGTHVYGESEDRITQ